MSRIIDEHRQLLADDVRLRAFETALKETVQPSDTVLDLASGTGILGFLACRAGARHVYSVDNGGIIQLARTIARDNGLSDRMTFVKGFSTQLELPERVDLVVADQAGHFGFEAGVIGYFEDARRRFLKPGGRFVPRRIEMQIAPVCAPDIHERIEFWKTPRRGIEFSAALMGAANSGYPIRLRPDQVLGHEATIATVDFQTPVPDVLTGRQSIEIVRDGVMHGLGGWFDSELSPGVRLTNSPLKSESIGRRNVVFPIEMPVQVASGDRVNVDMSIRHDQMLVNWRVEVVDAAGAKKAASSHSTWRGFLLSSEDLAHMRPGRAVRLSKWGVARRTLLDLCDGQRTAKDIEAALLATHPDLFPTAADAALFVAEVVIPYSE